MMAIYKNNLLLQTTKEKSIVTKSDNSKDGSSESLNAFKQDNINNVSGKVHANMMQNVGSTSIGGSAFTSPLLIASNNTIGTGNTNNNNTLGSGCLQMQSSSLSPRGESKIRTTINMKSMSFSNTTPFMNDSAYNKYPFDKSPFPPILPPSAIPLSNNNESNIDEIDNLANSRKGSFNYNNLITPIMLPTLMIPTPFLEPNMNDGGSSNGMNFSFSFDNNMPPQTPTFNYNTIFSDKKSSIDNFGAINNYNSADFSFRKSQIGLKTILPYSNQLKKDMFSLNDKSKLEDIQKKSFHDNANIVATGLNQDQIPKINLKDQPVKNSDQNTDTLFSSKYEEKKQHDVGNNNSKTSSLDFQTTTPLENKSIFYNDPLSNSNNNTENPLKTDYSILHAIKKSPNNKPASNVKGNDIQKSQKSVSPFSDIVFDKAKVKKSQTKKTKNDISNQSKINKLSLENILNVGDKKSTKKVTFVNTKILANPRANNRQRSGSSCNLCQFKKCKCNSIIEVLVEDDLIFKFDPVLLEKKHSTESFESSVCDKKAQLNSKLHYNLDLSDLRILQTLQSWLYKNELTLPDDIKKGVFKEKNVSYYKHLNKIIKITSCSHCVSFDLPCNFEYGYSKEDKKLCYKLHLKIKKKNKTAITNAKESETRNDISKLPKDSCSLGRLTVKDYYNFLGL